VTPYDGSAGSSQNDDEAPPEPVRRLGQALRVRATDEAPTEGFLVTGGEVVHDDLFSAEPDGRLRSRQIRAGSLPAAGVGLRGKAARATVMDHVEAQAAAILRRPGGGT
jgi:hypothetical protein